MDSTAQPFGKDRYAVALPCEPEQFGKFISGLLGKPQTITGFERGAFEIRKQDITNTHHLVLQRVQQQNDGQLIEFTIQLVFDDQSSVLLSGLEDLLSYTEIRPIAPQQLNLSWVFLVKFHDKPHPEKQHIELSFSTSRMGFMPFGDEEVMFLSSVAQQGMIGFRIKHTARTWGADMESLLAGHARHHLIPEPQVRKFVRTHSGKIGFALAATFFLATVAACLLAADRLATLQLEQISEILKSVGATDLKLNKLLEMAADGFWGKFFFSVFIFVLVSLVLSVLLGTWSSATADTHRPSYILLTRKAEQLKESKSKGYDLRWIWFLGSIVTSIITGIVSNILFTKYWTS